MILWKQCPLCKKGYQVHVPDKVYNSWAAGEKIQDVWPEAKPETREMLITGLCLDCQDEVFVR